MDPALEAIRKKMGHLTFKGAPTLWLDTGIPELNQVAGNRENGLAYGRIMEVFGWESHGKSAISMALAALAQRDGAHVILMDLENSYEEQWVRRRGIDPEKNFTLIQPYVGIFGKEKKPRLATAQELCEEAEEVLEVKRKKADRMVLIVDSLTSLLTAGEAAAGLTGQNLRTKMDLPEFLGRLLRRWAGTAASYNVMLMLINQLRENPMAFGDSTYTPGGNAPKFFSHVRVKVTRVRGGRITDKGVVVGIRGIMKAVKNKVGGLEGAEVGYKLMFNGPIEFLPAKRLRAEAQVK